MPKENNIGHGPWGSLKRKPTLRKLVHGEHVGWIRAEAMRTNTACSPFHPSECLINPRLFILHTFAEIR